MIDWQDGLNKGDWVIFTDYDNDFPSQSEIVGQIYDIDESMVKLKYHDPKYHYSVAIVNRYCLTKTTKEVADIMRGV